MVPNSSKAPVWRYSVDASSGTPVYRQFVDQTYELVASGVLSAGDQLPTVRAVVAELGVNPKAVSKAYAMLVGDGVVARRRGAVLLVTEKAVGTIHAMRPYLEALVDNGRRLGLTPEEVVVAVKRAWVAL